MPTEVPHLPFQRAFVSSLPLPLRPAPRMISAKLFVAKLKKMTEPMELPEPHLRPSPKDIMESDINSSTEYYNNVDIVNIVTYH